ncbi:transmembrane signal receptor [Lithospermum erythrorhizon]|uniref:Transmembrane signal receptor n=1 Tax=Lithospermum erythrorhizon TaxID=34254 RepID=A0AAV3P3G6_LITER
MEKSDVKVLPVLVIVLIALLSPQIVVGDPRSQTVKMICGTDIEYNSTIYVPNFVNTMENISAQIRSRSYGLAKTGSGYDTNYGFAQCYGDLSLLDCVLCYAEARTILPSCYPVTGGRIFFDGCFMRAENYTFFQEYTGPNDTAICGNRTRKNQYFEQIAKTAISQAVTGAPNNNFSARVEVPTSRTSNESVYVLADCWKTLNVNSCRACLENASNSMLGCLPWSEGRALNTGCFMRYSDTNFLNRIEHDSKSRGSLIVVIVSVASSAIVLAVGAVIGVYFWKRKNIEKRRKGGNDVKKLVKTLNDSSLNFKYSTLEKATASFSEANKLGQGGFGTVYKGALHDGREIAVKRLFVNNRHRAADFYNEVNIISTLEHKNLVRLLGCSCSGPESLLVYEFLPNKSLDLFIFDLSNGKSLNWERRFEIIMGTAEGLVYLHENSKIRIIHRDIKASNILLDARLRAKIADFGLARSFQEDKSHISTAIAGTLGYLAPEYLAHGQLTEKVDVYSFGVLLLEIVTGRQNNKSKSSEYSDSLINIAWNHFQQRKVEELFDPNLLLHNHHNLNVKRELLRVVHVGLLCTQEIPSLRPSMSKALLMLVKKEEPLPAPTNPPFIDERTTEFHDMIDSSNPSDTVNSDSIASISHSIFYPR